MFVSGCPQDVGSTKSTSATLAKALEGGGFLLKEIKKQSSKRLNFAGKTTENTIRTINGEVSHWRTLENAFSKQTWRGFFVHGETSTPAIWELGMEKKGYKAGVRVTKEENVREVNFSKG